MNKRIIYKKNDGSIGIIVPVEKLRQDNETEKAFLENLASNLIASDIPRLIISIEELPERTFRNAWEWKGDKNPQLKINLKKAKKIWLNKWRETRKPLLEKLDIEYFVAVENKDEESQNEIAQKKQELRDLTKHDLSGVTNVGQLKEIWPSTLGDIDAL
jgi:hypothetical protein